MANYSYPLASVLRPLAKLAGQQVLNQDIACIHLAGRKTHARCLFLAVIAYLRETVAEGSHREVFTTALLS